MADPEYLRFPGLEIEPSGTGARVRNPILGYELDAPAAMRRVLEAAYPEPRSAARLGLDPTGLAEMRRRYLLVTPREAEFMAVGLQQAPERLLAPPLALADLPLPGTPSTTRLALLGAPIDAGGGLGARRGPALVRRAFALSFNDPPAPAVLDFEARRRIELANLEIADLGDLPWAPDDGLERFGRRLQHVVERLLSASIRPFVIGGDHSISAYLLPVLLDRHPGLHLVHFDAHTDLFSHPGRRPALTHANAMLPILRDPRLGGLLQLGLRTLEPDFGNRRADPRLSYRSARELARLDPAEVAASLPADAPCYLSFDVDVVSPFEAPNTGTPEIGGLSYYQAAELLAAISARVDLVGADFVEVAGTPGALTGTNTTALITARLMLQLLLDFAPATRLDSYAPAESPDAR